MRLLPLCLAILLLTAAAIGAPHAAPARAARSLPPTNVSVRSGYIVVSTTVDKSVYDTFVYVAGQTPGVNFIYHAPLPASIANDAGWNCPCTAQIANQGRSGTLKLLTAVSAPFMPSP